MLGKTTNPLLQKTEAATEAKVPPKYKGAFQRIVAAGLKVMYSEQTHDMMVKELQKPQDPSINIGEGVAKLMGILWSQGKGTLPMQAMIPATTILMCEAIDFAEKAGKFTATPESVAAVTKETMSDLMQLLGVTPQKIQQAKQSTQPAQPVNAKPGLIASQMKGA